MSCPVQFHLCSVYPQMLLWIQNLTHMLLTKKQMKQEVDRLTIELPLITSQRNELQDCPTFISENTMENRYSLFQSSWDLQQCHPHLFPLRFWVLKLRTSSVTNVLDSSQER